MCDFLLTYARIKLINFVRQNMRIIKVISLCSFIICLTVSCNNQKEPKLVLNETSLSLYQEDTFLLTAKMSNSKDNLLYFLSWSSSNEDVATVSNGEVTAIGAGTATITVKSTFNDNYVAECEVTVTREAGFDYEIGQADGEVVDDYYRFYIPVKNTGTMNICLYRMKYEITNKYGDELYDSVFNMNATPKIIAPGETGYFYDCPSNIYDSFKDKTSKDLVVIQHPTIKKAKDYKCARYEASNVSLEEDTYGIRKYFKGTITNNSNERIISPAVALQLYGENDKLIYCYSTRFQEGIEPGVTKEYFISVPTYGGEVIDLLDIRRIKPISYDDVNFE